MAKDPPRSLAQRDLERGVRLGPPDGMTVAEAMGIPLLSAHELGPDDLDGELGPHPPLWSSVLGEAEVLGGGRALPCPSQDRRSR